VSHEQLQEEVWDAVRSRSAVRSVVKVLRAKLRKAGMTGLADAIDGHVAGHYALFIDGGS
jgi:DNA-binding response OmpR family regulator